MVKNKLDHVFQKLKKEKKKALITYMAAGYPKFSEQEKLVLVLKESGADVLELGIPFSDPIADGPTIQFASQEALKNGVSLKKILNWTARLTKKVDLPIIYMSYMNPIYAHGLKKFVQDAKRAQVSGVIIPDLIPEEAAEISATLGKENIHLIFLVAPTTPLARLKSIAQKTKGFLYAVSVTGVTGARKSFSSQINGWLKSLQRLTKKPVCVGFGISEPAHIKSLRKCVDGFIVGSALVDVIRRNSSAKRSLAVKKFIRGLSKECAYGH